MRSLPLLLIATTSASAVPASAPQAVARRSAHRLPADGAHGYMRPRDDVNIDSVSCWRLLKPFSIGGLPVTGICGFDEEGWLAQAMQPGLYSRGPGTLPGTRLTVITPAGIQQTQKWSTAGARIRSRIEPNEAFPRLGGTEVTCTMFMAEP